MDEWSNAKLCDIANLIVGVTLTFSPLIFGYVAGVGTQNAIISGIIIAVFSAGALAEFGVWEELVNLSAGLWVIAAPWALKFHNMKITRDTIIFGIVVTLLAIVELLVRTLTRPNQSQVN